MTKHFKPEVLAPAGGPEQLRAAVLCGADAVYLGLSDFNARAGAENFTPELLLQSVSWCHARGVRVYVTLNTLVTDREIPLWERSLAAVAAAGADGVIVQDLGMAALARRLCPTLPLHGSTQMTVHNLAGCRVLEEMGFEQVVLARELTREEIAAIAAGTSLRTEVFVHGALCMSVSGQCYLSGILGERSGNRGQCAQPCRLNFKSHGREYALSLKDLTLTDRLPDLAALGVASFKIEGRLKRPEYVAAAVTACREALAGKTPDLAALSAVFSRSGFTDGYYTGERDLRMFGVRSREDVAATAEVLSSLGALTRNEVGRVPVTMELTLKEREPVRLSVSDGSRTVTVTGDCPEKAENRPTDEALCQRALEKCGGTPFTLSSLTCRLEEGLRLPQSALNRLRKEALEALAAERGRVAPHPYNETAGPGSEPPAARPQRGAPDLRCRFRAAAQIPPALRAGGGRLSLPLAEVLREPELAARLGERLSAELPLLVSPLREDALREDLRKLKALRVNRVVAGNLGTAALARELDFFVTGDYSLNLLNSEALRAAAALGCGEATLSFEGERGAAQRMVSPIPIGVIAYGHLPLMTYRNCPGKGRNGCGACRGVNELQDRRGNTFPLLCHRREYSQLLNPQPLFLSDRLPEWRFADFLTLYFTTETAAECEKILLLYESGGKPAGAFTRGLYYRGLK